MTPALASIFTDLWNEQLVSNNRQGLFMVLVGFVGSFGFIRMSARIMRSPRISWWPGSVISDSGVHLHHLVWGIVTMMAAGTLFGSIAIMADALNNLSDASSNVVSLVGFRLAAKGPDEKHPYGHVRYEYLAGLVVCVTILAIGLSLLKESALKVLHPTAVVFSWLSVGVLAVSIGVKLWMSRFNKTIGQRINSETLMATAADSRNDVLTTSAVLLSTVLSHLTGWDVLDGLMGVAVAAFILWSGWGLMMDTLSPLLGESPSPELVEHIEHTVMSYPGVLGVHDLMVHDYGPGHQFASLHIEFPAEADPLEAHNLWNEPSAAATKLALLEQLAQTLIGHADMSPLPTSLA